MDLNLTAGEFSCFFVMASCLGLSCQNRYDTVRRRVRLRSVKYNRSTSSVLDVIAQAFSSRLCPWHIAQSAPLRANQVSAGSDDYFDPPFFEQATTFKLAACKPSERETPFATWLEPPAAFT